MYRRTNKKLTYYERFWWPIRRTFWTKPRQLYRRLKNLVIQTGKYIVFVWKNEGDYDWDYAYLYNILRWKLTNMADCIDSNQFIESHKRVAKQLRYAVYLIDRIEYNEDFEKADAAHQEKWGKRKYLFAEDGNFTLPDGTKIDGRGLSVKYENVKTKEEYDQAEGEWINLVAASDEKKEELKHRLFKHIANYIEKWWD